MLDKEVIEMYRIIITALDYYTKLSSYLVMELKKSEKPYSERIMQLFEDDLKCIPTKTDPIIKTMTEWLGSHIDIERLPAYVRQNEKIISASLALYRRDLIELQNFPKNQGFDEVELPNVKNQIELVDDIVKAVNLKLPQITNSHSESK